ncbi:MAG: helix-turn-helix domain-containing protein [Bacteroidales bacterium]|nr:helix-turn-helix domain-containing protein [Bacteroidales bacterium]
MGGIMRLNPGNYQVRGFAINNRAPIKNGCYSLLETEYGRWLVGALEGLYLFDVARGLVSQHPAVTKEPELGKRLITALFKDRAERIWIGTDEGFYRLSSQDETIQTQADLFPSVERTGFYVHQIMQDSDGRIWIASSKGLLEYSDISEPRLYTIEDGLPDNNVRAVLGGGGNGDLWICSGRILCWLNVGTRTVTVINRPTGNEFAEGAAIVGSNGLFYFGGLGGLTCFNPNDMYSNPFSPKPYFSSVDFDGRSRGDMVRNENGACVSVSASAIKGPLVVHWSVVNPLSYGANIFYFRLDGLDDKWHKTESRQATFMNLAPGNYILQLRCANNEGILCNGSVSMAVHIIPRWWQSRIFRALLILFSIIIFCFALTLVASLLRTKMKLHTRDAEVRRLEDDLEKTRELISGQIRDGLPGVTASDGDFLHRARQIVEANIDNEAFCSDDFAAQMYISRSKLYARIHETTGGTVSDYIRKIRFERACTLLSDDRYSISEISAMVGFSSPSYFATSFKKHMGCLPKEYGKRGDDAAS